MMGRMNGVYILSASCIQFSLLHEFFKTRYISLRGRFWPKVVDTLATMAVRCKVRL